MDFGMETIDCLVQKMRRMLSRPFRTSDEAAAVAVDLFVLVEWPDRTASLAIADLLNNFRATLHAAGLENVLKDRLDYGGKIASDKSLLPEEIYKLVGICGQVHALRSLGYSADPALLAQFEKAACTCFSANRDAALDAIRRQERESSRSLWWYARFLLHLAKS
jgi:hypothetical protein